MTASTDPNIVGVTDICVACGWFFRRAACQTHRMYCRACESKNG